MAAYEFSRLSSSPLSLLTISWKPSGLKLNVNLQNITFGFRLINFPKFAELIISTAQTKTQNWSSSPEHFPKIRLPRTLH